jgi:hypothetical protein
MDAHDLMVKLKDMAIELGRTPKRDEFIKEIKNGKKLVEKAFKTYAAMVIASGLDTPRAKKVDNTIFNRDIEQHLSSYAPQPLAIVDPYPTAAIISDIHWPFSNERVINRFQQYVGDVKPEWVCLNGDAWDMYSHGRFPRSHNVFTPREEENRARTMNEEFWKAVRASSPLSKCVQLLGNHDVRPLKRMLETYPEAEDWIKERINKMFTFDGVKTIFDIREELYLNKDVVVFHGFRSKLGDHRDYTMLSTFNGHSHKGGVVFRQIRGRVLFECNSGLAGDAEAKGLTYTPQKISDWTPGFASLDALGPRFIHA